MSFVTAMAVNTHASLLAIPASLSLANADLQAGKADEAIALLNAAIQSDPGNAEAYNLLCRVEYALQEFDQAALHCEKAVKLAPQNARYHLWLGRAIGERADHANFITAFALAKKAREEFETSVGIDPRDPDSLSDLGEFYKDAPGAVGGGIEKEEGIVQKLESVDPALTHQLRAKIAEKNKDFGVAEQEFKAAIAIAKHPARAWVDLASFYRRQERWTDMEAAVRSAVAAVKSDKHSVVVLYDGASLLAKTDRQTDLAQKLYESYINSPDKTEEAPAFEALTRLAKLQQKLGDMQSAQRNRNAALALAHDYKPALQLKP
jgi:tetratricopeptide (TPR) repeat protein